jgi:hypothetical protein
VVLGHVNGGGQAGIFHRLHELAAGDEVYGDTTGPELRLITCGGVFDGNTHHYRDNVIVYAVLS